MQSVRQIASFLACVLFLWNSYTRIFVFPDRSPADPGSIWGQGDDLGLSRGLTLGDSNEGVTFLWRWEVQPQLQK